MTTPEEKLDGDDFYHPHLVSKHENPRFHTVFLHYRLDFSRTLAKGEWTLNMLDRSLGAIFENFMQRVKEAAGNPSGDSWMQVEMAAHGLPNGTVSLPFVPVCKLFVPCFPILMVCKLCKFAASFGADQMTEITSKYAQSSTDFDLENGVELYLNVISSL